MLLAACAPQSIVETVVVTQVVEVEGTPVIQTQVVEVTPVPTEEPSEPFNKISPEFKNPDTLTLITGAGEPETLDPAWSYETAGSAIITNVYESLVFFNREKTDEYVPMLATDWSTSEDQTVWTFNIREGVKFHEGGTLEPHDVAYTLQRALLQGRIDGPHWMTYEAILGPDLALASVEDMAATMVGKESFEDLTPAELVSVCETVKERLVADDEAGTFTLTLNQPVPWILAILSQTFLGGIVDSEWMIENGEWDGDSPPGRSGPTRRPETILFDQGNGTGRMCSITGRPVRDRPDSLPGLLANRADVGGAQRASQYRARGGQGYPRVGHPPGNAGSGRRRLDLRPGELPSTGGALHQDLLRPTRKLRRSQLGWLYPGLPPTGGAGHHPRAVQLEHQHRRRQPVHRQWCVGWQRHPGRLFQRHPCPQGVRVLQLPQAMIIDALQTMLPGAGSMPAA
jgi:hypothetical protein